MTLGPVSPEGSPMPPHPTCSIDGCEKKPLARGLCSPHYNSARAYGAFPPLPTQMERFWARVDTSAGPDACWPWTASRQRNGYGNVQWDGKVRKAHRVAYLLAGGLLTAGAPWVLHHCDNPPCCNERHLYAGDRAQNMLDMKTRGRGRGTIAAWNVAHPERLTGESHPQHKLTADQVEGIRADLARGVRKSDIARGVGVSATLIRYIAKGIAWPVRNSA